MDSRTAVRKFNLIPAGFVTAGTKTFKIYNVDVIKKIEDRLKQESE
jgi:hypothetical protein